MEIKDYRQFEMDYSPPHKVVKSLRLSMPLEAHLDEMAEEHEISSHRLVRLAIYEFLVKNGRDPLVLPGS